MPSTYSKLYRIFYFSKGLGITTKFFNNYKQVNVATDCIQSAEPGAVSLHGVGEAGPRGGAVVAAPGYRSGGDEVVRYIITCAI